MDKFYNDYIPQAIETAEEYLQNQKSVDNLINSFCLLELKMILTTTYNPLLLSKTHTLEQQLRLIMTIAAMRGLNLKEYKTKQLVFSCVDMNTNTSSSILALISPTLNMTRIYYTVGKKAKQILI